MQFEYISSTVFPILYALKRGKVKTKVALLLLWLVYFPDDNSKQIYVQPALTSKLYNTVLAYI